MANRNRLIRSRQKVKLDMPPWTVRLYTALAIILVPWIIFLAAALPTHYVSANWDVIWAGLDVGLFLSFLVSAILAYKKSRWVAMAATITGTLLLVDAWFDVLSEHSHLQFIEAVAMAAIIEIPLAIISFSVAVHVLHHNID